MRSYVKVSVQCLTHSRDLIKGDDGDDICGDRIIHIIIMFVLQTRNQSLRLSSMPKVTQLRSIGARM